MAGDEGADAKPVRRGGRPPPLSELHDEEDREAKALEKRNKAIEAEARLRDRDLRHLMSLQQFQRFLERVLEDANIYGRSYETKKRRLIDEGRAMMAMEILNEIDGIDPGFLIRLMAVRAQRRTDRK